MDKFYWHYFAFAGKQKAQDLPTEDFTHPDGKVVANIDETAKATGQPTAENIINTNGAICTKQTISWSTAFLFIVTLIISAAVLSLKGKTAKMSLTQYPSNAMENLESMQKSICIENQMFLFVTQIFNFNTY